MWCIKTKYFWKFTFQFCWLQLKAWLHEFVLILTQLNICYLTVYVSVRSYFRPTKFKTHYVAPQIFIFRRTVQIAPNFVNWNAHIFRFDLILWVIPYSITPQTTDSGRIARIPLYPPVQAVPLTPSTFFFFLSRTEEPAKTGTCIRDKGAGICAHNRRTL